MTAAEIASRKDSRSLTRPAHEPWRTMSAYGGVALGAVAMAIVALVIHGYRLSQSPDVIVDETVYYLVAHSVQVGTGLAFHPLPGNNPFFWQPPLFFVVEAGWLSNFGSSGGDLFHALYAARFLNVVIAALTAAGIVVLGSRLWDAKAGVLMSALYVLDPFIQRGTRRNMLEPLAGLFLLVTVLLILRYVDVRRRRWLIAAGVSAGLALLSKEIAFFVLAVPFGLAVFERFRTWLLNGVLMAATAGAVYLVYPLWAFAIGAGDAFIGYKAYQLSRFAGIVQITGWNQPAGASGRPSYLDALGVNVPLYGSSYTLIALGGLTLLGLLVFQRRDPRMRVLLTWGGVTYVNFSFIILRGQLNDQFFYLLVLPAAVLAGYLARASLGVLAGYLRRVGEARAIAVPGATITLIALIATQTFGASLYVRDTVIGSDDAYYQAYAFLRKTVPPGQAVLVDTEAADYLFRDYAITRTRDLRALIDQNVRFFVLSDKAQWGRFDGISPTFYDWIATNSREIFEVRGNTFWTVRVFERVGSSIRPRSQ